MMHVELTESEANALAAVLAKVLAAAPTRHVTTPAKAKLRHNDSNQELLDTSAM